MLSSSLVFIGSECCDHPSGLSRSQSCSLHCLADAAEAGRHVKSSMAFRFGRYQQHVASVSIAAIYTLLFACFDVLAGRMDAQVSISALCCRKQVVLHIIPLARRCFCDKNL